MYETAERQFTEIEAREILDTQLSLYKLFNLNEALGVSQKAEFVKSDSEYKLSVKLTCLEEIGYKENLVVNPQ